MSQDERREKLESQEPSWLSSDEVFVFGGRPEPVPGSSEDHAMSDWYRNLIPRKKEEVKADWNRIVRQIQELLQDVALPPSDFQLDEVTFELGFNAQGKIVFIAEGGIEATLSMNFKRASTSEASATGTILS